jgi:integrase
MTKAEDGSRAFATHVDFSTVFNCWLESAPDSRVRTRHNWKTSLRHISLFLGHANAADISRDDVLNWKDQLLREGKAVATVRGLFINSMSAMFSAAQNAHLIPENPFLGVRFPKVKPKILRSKGYSDREARQILLAALTTPRGLREEQHNHMFRRWAPWLCAFTGARIAEIAQLRKQDVGEVDGVPVLYLTPDAGSIKTDRARTVPLHPQLVKLGFLDFAKEVGGVYLFQSKESRSPVYRGSIVGKWVRSLAVSVPAVQPNHAWRHRFKSICREAGIPSEYNNALTGHSNRANVGNVYGEYPPLALHREICKLPWVRTWEPGRIAGEGSKQDV